MWCLNLARSRISLGETTVRGLVPFIIDVVQWCICVFSTAFDYICVFCATFESSCAVYLNSARGFSWSPGVAVWRMSLKNKWRKRTRETRRTTFRIELWPKYPCSSRNWALCIWTAIILLVLFSYGYLSLACILCDLVRLPSKIEEVSLDQERNWGKTWVSITFVLQLKELYSWF